MAGGFSAVAISWRGAPFVFLQLLQRAHCSGDHPLWRGTQIPSRPYGRPGSRWQTPLCLPCTVCKLEWYTAGRSPAGTSPPAQERKRKGREEGIIAQLQRNSSRLLKQLHVWSAASAQNIYGWSLSLEAELVKSVIQKMKITIKTLSSWKLPPPPGSMVHHSKQAGEKKQKTEQAPACFTIRLSHDKNVNTPTSWCSARIVVFVTECDRCLLSGKENSQQPFTIKLSKTTETLPTCSRPAVRPTWLRWLERKERGQSEESRANSSQQKRGTSSPPCMQLCSSAALLSISSLRASSRPSSSSPPWNTRSQSCWRSASVAQSTAACHWRQTKCISHWRGLKQLAIHENLLLFSDIISGYGT